VLDDVAGPDLVAVDFHGLPWGFWVAAFKARGHAAVKGRARGS
jgi:hypothetical protein